jgi:FkbM family methyltransferase
MINLGHYVVPVDTKNGVCIDIGANLGDFTDQYRNHFSKIIYVEPQIELFNNLQTRFKILKHIIGYNKAAWSESGVGLNLVAHSNMDSGSVGVSSGFLNKDWTNNIVNSTLSITLADLLTECNISNVDYLKVDCETSEYQFLYNKDLSMIKYLGIEIHSQMGIELYNLLLSWINKTHVLVSGDPTFINNINKEVLFKLK